MTHFDLPALAPSILAADYTRLGEQIDACREAGALWIHCDIMDGHFVPNISFGPDFVRAAASTSSDLFVDVHLMIESPDNYIEAFADAGADLISVHYEACPHLHRTLQNIELNGCMTGVAINPGTSADLLYPVLGQVDLIVVMSVNPGFGGQSFIESSFEKIRKLTAMRKESGTDFLIQVDGGVGMTNISRLSENGVDVLVAGSSVFRADSIQERISELRKKASEGRKSLA